MGSYNFTYKDVLKRYERIINKPSKFEIRLLATILLIITIVNITTLCFAAEGTLLEGYSAYGGTIHTAANSNMLYYYPIYEGREYIVNKTEQWNLTYAGIFFSLSIEPDSTATLLKDFGETTSSFTFISPENGYLIVSSSASLDPSDVEFIDNSESMQKSVDVLVDNVGITQIWDVFDTGIGFVVVVVIAAFGIFLVVIAIRKMQKGKSDF